MESKRIRVVGAALLIAATSAAGAAARMELVSRAVPWTGSRTAAEGGFISWTSPRESLSGNGRFAVFLSSSTDLVPGQSDANGTLDVFFYDRLTNQVRLVSHKAGTRSAAADAISERPAISRDGRFVTFVSQATDLVFGAGTAAGTSQIYLWDRFTGHVALVSHASGSPALAGNGSAIDPRLDDDGRFVVFLSDSTDLVAGQQTAGHPLQVFLWDRLTGQTRMVSHSALSPVTGGNDMASSYTMSADGRFIAFSSIATDLVPGQGGPPFTGYHVFLYDRTTGVNQLLSHASGAPTDVANGNTDSPVISPNGRFVAFLSAATDLVPGFQVAEWMNHLFLHDRLAGTTVLVSHASGSESDAGDGPADELAVTEDGIVAYLSYASDLQTEVEDVNFGSDLFLYDPVSQTNVLLSRSAGSPSTAAGARPPGPAISRDGGRIAFSSEALDLVPGQVMPPNSYTPNVFLFHRDSGTMELVSRSTDSPPTAGNHSSTDQAIDDQGRCVLFTSAATDFVRGDRNGFADVFLRCD